MSVMTQTKQPTPSPKKREKVGTSRGRNDSNWLTVARARTRTQRGLGTWQESELLCRVGHGQTDKRGRDGRNPPVSADRCAVGTPRVLHQLLEAQAQLRALPSTTSGNSVVLPRTLATSCVSLHRPPSNFTFVTRNSSESHGSNP